MALTWPARAQKSALAHAAGGLAPKLTFGGVEIAFSSSTVKLGLVCQPMTMAVRLLGKVRTEMLYSCTALM
jgi:hypothetical protein